MSDRGGVRSSARLSGDSSVATAAAPAARAQGRGRPVSTTAAAALRRARAAERAAEVEDSPRVLRDKCRRLARALRNAKHLVVYTGAGISTAADIPDYRGPHGVWTRLQRGETVGRVEVSRAQPTFTHMALTALWARGALKFVVSQNCDGLHLRAGLPRRALAELHGDMFAELCAPCRRVYLRAFDTTERTARHAHGTRRLCHACGQELRDSIVHFGERGRAAWPLNWAGALRHAARADVVLCLGSSLKVLRRYPRLWRMQSAPRARPALYIVNLQWTPKDSVAALKINARCDAVMRQVARRLRLRVPAYRGALDPVLAHAEPLAAPERHTSRRPPLAPRSPPAAHWEPSSPSASDSDEELPLRHLAARLRGPASRAHSFASDPGAPVARVHDPGGPVPRAPDPGPPDPGPPDPGAPVSRASSPGGEVPDELHAPDLTDRLHSFQVSLQSGDATILLRAEHARCRPDLRRLRPPPNGHASRLRRLLDYEPRIDDDAKPERDDAARDKPERDDVARVKPERDDAARFKPERDDVARFKPERDDAARVKPEPKDEPEDELKESASSSESSGAEGAGSLAAAIIRRAVLLCRASLYPGLHSIIAPAPAPAPECAWCARHFAARRCLWYGPAREPALAARAWRRLRGRRYLCACCGGRESPARDAAPLDDGGWYGKGYRKGRRRRR